MPCDLSRGTAAQRVAHLKRLAWVAREKGRRASWSVLSEHQDRDTIARRAFEHEHAENDESDFSPAIVIAQRDRFYPGILITQCGLRCPMALAEYAAADRGEDFARALREFARGSLHFSVGNFVIVDSRIVAIAKGVA